MIRVPKACLGGARVNTKGRQRTSRRVPSTLVVGLVILAAGFGMLSVTDPVTALHWCPSIGAAYTPAVFYQGVTTVFTVTLTNNIGDALTVTNVLLDFNWDGDTSSNGWDYDFGGTTIAPGTSENLVQSITPPSATPAPTPTPAPRADSGEYVRGVAEGDLRHGLLLDLLPPDLTLAEDSLVSTSGLGGNYPRALLIGTVESVEQRPQSPFTRATIEPAAALSGLDTVLILLSFQPARLSGE